MMLALAMTACSKSDDEETTPKPKAIDPALLGVWTNEDAKATKNISQAAYFKDNEVLFFYENNWYFGVYSVTDSNHFTANVSQATRIDFTWFDNYNVFSIGENSYNWVIIYKITGNKLYLERGGRSMNLVKYE